MAKLKLEITEVHESIGVTIGQPDYSSIKVDVGLTARVGKGQDPEKVRDELVNQLSTAFTQDVEFLTKMGKQVIAAGKKR
jgi:hypothetical protein